MRNGWCAKAFGSLCHAWILIVIALVAVWGGWRFGKSRGCFVPVAAVEKTKDVDSDSSHALRDGVNKTDDLLPTKNEPAVPGQPPQFAASAEAVELEQETIGPGPRVPHPLQLPPRCDPALVGLANFEPAIVQHLVRLAGYDGPIEIVNKDGKKQPPPIIDLNPPRTDKNKLPPSTPDLSTPLPAPREQTPLCTPPSRILFLGDRDLDRLVRPALPTAQDLENLRKYTAGVVDPTNTLELIEGRSRVVVLKAAPKRIQVARDSMVTCGMSGGHAVNLVGHRPGTTVVNFWFAADDDRETLVSYLVRVVPSPDVLQRAESACKGLEAEINRTFQGCQVQLSLVGDAVVVRGDVVHRRLARQVLEVVAANHAKVVDQLRIAGPDQVMLRVVIAEVNRTAAERLGASLPSPEQGMCLDGGAATQTMGVMRSSPCARILAETNVVTLDGHVARLAAAGNTLATSCGFCRAQMPYGVHMEFLPTILDDGRVRMEVSASINDNRQRSGTDDPNLGAFASTLEMTNGETLAVAAMVRTTTSCSLLPLPFLRCQPAEQQLVILITPEIVMPGEHLHQ